MAVDVRPARRADVPAIRAVATAAWHEAHAPIVGTDAVEAFLAAHYDAASVASRVDRADADMVVAADESERVVGYALATPGEGATFNLAQIYVDPDRWGEGIGGQLLDHVETRVESQGGERLRLSVMADNDRAIGFYEAAGYERVDAFDDDDLDTQSYTYEKAIVD